MFILQLGKNQEYNLGLQIRKRYNKFLGPYYSPNWLYARTTDFERTHMSEQAMLTGLYPPKGDQQWSLVVKNWQPIPIRSFPEGDDPVTMYIYISFILNFAFRDPYQK